MKKIFITLIACLISLVSMAQDMDPYITYVNKETLETDTLRESGVLSTEAPLEITMHVDINCPANYSYELEWKIVSSEDETDILLDRFEPESSYEMDVKGTYKVSFTGCFTNLSGDSIFVDKEMAITIIESELHCPDGISPNGDGHNDKLYITAKSIVSLKGCIFNRWGQKIVDINLDSLEPKDAGNESEKNKYSVWDGYVNGKPAKDGVYFINIDARGSDGVHYKIKKAINVLKSLYSVEHETDGIDQ